MKPAHLSFDLNLVDLSVSGFWFCLRCRKITEPEENYAGVNGCLFCSSPRIRWNPPIFEPSEITHHHADKKTIDSV